MRRRGLTVADIERRLHPYAGRHRDDRSVPVLMRGVRHPEDRTMWQGVIDENFTRAWRCEHRHTSEVAAARCARRQASSTSRSV